MIVKLRLEQIDFTALSEFLSSSETNPVHAPTGFVFLSVGDGGVVISGEKRFVTLVQSRSVGNNGDQHVTLEVLTEHCIVPRDAHSSKFGYLKEDWPVPLLHLSNLFESMALFPSVPD